MSNKCIYNVNERDFPYGIVWVLLLLSRTRKKMNGLKEDYDASQTNNVYYLAFLLFFAGQPLSALNIYLSAI